MERYAGLQVKPSFGASWPADLEGRPLREVRIGRLSVIADHDTQATVFSPTTGHCVEAELCWLAAPRWPLLGFGGAGRAWGRRDEFNEAATITAQSVGFQDLIAKALGIHPGIDVARSPADTVFYSQVGSPWR